MSLHFTGTCFIQKIYAPSSSLLQGKHLPFAPSPLRLNMFGWSREFRMHMKNPAQTGSGLSVSMTEIFTKPRSLFILVQFA
jgi:hypothetical protein